jgi:hypothetical protein
MNKILLLLPFLLFGCNKKYPQTLIGLWGNKTVGAERHFASGGAQGLCHQNTFNVNTLKEEIKALEKMFPKQHELEGSWKHLNFLDLPLPQANFLKKYGTKIGDLKNPQAINYSSCSDVPCIFNRIYGKNDGVEGYVHYLWFLRFGHLLSADNEVPVRFGNPTPGMYNDKKIPLKDFLFSKTELQGFWRLSKMLKHPHSNLKYVTEIQRIPKGHLIQGVDKNVCGRAHGYGWIILNDGCLVFEKDIDKGYFYQAVSHEMSHQVDFQEGRGTVSGFRSQKEDYLNLIGMQRTEYKDDKGNIVSAWKLQPDAKLVSDYASDSPGESFAEDLALFRIEADLTKKKISDEHFNFVSEKYYQGANFLRETLISNWINDYASGLTQDQLVDRISVSEPEGCAVLKDQQARARLTESLTNFKSSDSLNDKKFAREAYLECFGKEDEESCYSELISDSSFSEIKQETLTSYNFFVDSKIDVINRFALKLWDGCRSQPLDDSERPSGNLFLISNGYMVSSLYNCINANLPDKIKESVRNFSVDGVRLQHAQEEVILSQFVKTKMVQALLEKYDTEKIKEKMRAELFIAQDRGRLRKSLKTSASCEVNALKAITFAPAYHLKSELFTEFIRKRVCLR